MSEKMKLEFSRWIDAGRPSVFFKREGSQSWDMVDRPLWMPGNIYIVNDDQAILRKLQIDSPDTEFEYRMSNGGWAQAMEPGWNPGTKYREKSKEWIEYASEKTPVLCWVWDNPEGTNKYPRRVIGKGNYFVTDYGTSWSYAEPIKPEECWTDPTTYASTS